MEWWAGSFHMRDDSVEHRHGGHAVNQAHRRHLCVGFGWIPSWWRKTHQSNTAE